MRSHRLQDREYRAGRREIDQPKPAWIGRFRHSPQLLGGIVGAEIARNRDNRRMVERMPVCLDSVLARLIALTALPVVARAVQPDFQLKLPANPITAPFPSQPPSKVSGLGDANLVAFHQNGCMVEHIAMVDSCRAGEFGDRSRVADRGSTGACGRKKVVRKAQFNPFPVQPPHYSEGLVALLIGQNPQNSCMVEPTAKRVLYRRRLPPSRTARGRSGFVQTQEFRSQTKIPARSGPTPPFFGGVRRFTRP